jgi:rod shape-determining protein MreC
MARTSKLTRRQRTAAIVLAVVAACFITLDFGGSSLSSAHSGVRGALGSLYRGTDGVLGPLRRFAQGVPHAGSNESRVRSLQHENAELKKQVADAQVDKKTAARLGKLRLAATDGRYQVLPARVVAISPAEGFDWTVTLDVGASSQVRVGQSVTDGDGLVGRVVHADASTCVVLLAVDPGSGVGARDVRGGQVGVATGAGRTGFSFRPLDPRAKLQVGDQLSTGPSGSSSFVAGLAIGTVSAVRVSADGSTVAVVAPAVAPSDLDLVGVILVGGQTGTTRAPLNPKSDLAGGR